MKRLVLVVVLALAGCTPLALQPESLRQSFADKEECEQEATSATGAYKSGSNGARTWLDIKNDCLRQRMSAR